MSNSNSPQIEVRNLGLKIIPITLLIGLIFGGTWFTQFTSSALFMAASRGDSQQVQALLKRGIPVDSTDYFGKNTALIMAMRNPSSSTTRVLLDAGANVNAQNSFGNTALMLASSRGHIEIVRLLVSRGADVRMKNSHGHTALDSAVREGDLEVADILRKAGAKL